MRADQAYEIATNPIFKRLQSIKMAALEQKLFIDFTDISGDEISMLWDLGYTVIKKNVKKKQVRVYWIKENK